MRYVTAQKVAGIPTLADVTADQHRQVLDDASDLLGWITDNEWATDGAMRKAFEQRDWTTDRVNLALGVLRDTGHVLGLEPRHQALVAPGE